MRKESFIKMDLKTARCRECGRILKINNFSIRYIYSDKTGICKSCDWIRNHEDRINSISQKYDIILIIELIHYVFETSDINLMDFAHKYKINIEQVINIFDILKIGNKKLSIIVPCKCCGKDAIYTPHAFLLSDNHYCSHECYYKDKTNTVPHGKDNACFNRIKTKCTNCHKDIEVTPFQYNLTNIYGDNHNFCSQKCYWDFRSKYYVGEKSVSKFIKWTPELIEKMRINRAKSMHGENRLNTKPQIITDNILDKLNITYEREYNIKYYSIDNYLTDSKLMIEVMGDYWHGNPIRYNENKYGLNQKQLNGIHRDKLKYSYIKNHYDIEVLYLWETDLIKHTDVCEELIKIYISNNGNIKNYHSFNYSIKNNTLCLNSNIIIPYQNQSIENYRNLLNDKIS